MTQNIYKNIPQLFLSYREPYFGKEKYQHKKFETFSDKDKLLLEGEHTLYLQTNSDRTYLSTFGH